MSFTNTITSTYSDNAGVVVTSTVSPTGNEQIEWNGSIAASTTNQAIAMAFTTTSMQALLIYASGALTLTTNSSGSPVQTFSLTAGESIMWAVSGAAANPVTTSVTQLFATNSSSTAAAILQIRVLVNP